MERMGLILVDTSALISHFQGKVDLRKLLKPYESVLVSVLTLYELEYGALRAGRISDWHTFRRSFFLEALPLGEAEAGCAAQIQAELASRNARIGERDVLIAATALVRRLPLLTANVTEFQRVPDLQVVPLK